MPETNGCACDADQAEFIEDMPMRRYVNPVSISECGCEGGCNSTRCDCKDELDEILAALCCQNQLLTDLLGALNSLTATLLSDRSAACCAGK